MKKFITHSQLHDVEFDVEYRYHSMLCQGVEPTKALKALEDDMKDIEVLRKYTVGSVMRNIWHDVAMSTSKIGLEAHSAMNVEAIYPITDSIDDIEKTYRMHISSYSFKKPTKKVVLWLINYIYRHYGYTCTNKDTVIEMY